MAAGETSRVERLHPRGDHLPEVPEPRVDALRETIEHLALAARRLATARRRRPQSKPTSRTVCLLRQTRGRRLLRQLNSTRSPRTQNVHAVLPRRCLKPWTLLPTAYA